MGVFLARLRRGLDHETLFAEAVADSETMRTLRVARLKKWPLAAADVLPPLFDAALIFAGDSWSMTGWERGEPTGLQSLPALQQSWWMHPLSLKDQLELQRERAAALGPAQ